MKKLRNIHITMYYKIMFSFLGLLVALVAILMGTSLLARRNAEDFLRERLEERVEIAIEEVLGEMDNRGLSIDSPEVQVFMNDYTRRYDLKMALYKTDGQLIFSNHNQQNDLGKGQGAVKDKAYPVELTENRVEIVHKDEDLGYVTVRYMDFKNMSQTDLRFFDRITEVFRYAMLATLIITLIASFFIARSITIPIRKVTDTAGAISDGNLKARTAVKSNTREIIELSESINALATTLESEDHLRKQVTSDMAHEIRTPLTSLRNFFEAFIDGVYEPNETNMTKCHEEIIRMSDLVDRLKDLATIEAMNVGHAKSKLNLASEVTTMCDLLMPEFQKRNLSLSIDLDHHVDVWMNQNHLRQIISNLLTNANRYTDNGGDVVVTVTKEASDVILSVSDNGIGMSKEDQRNIFERFYRADKSRDRATGGMGVGLTIVKTLVETYGGIIKVTSDLSVGSTFTVKLPAKS